MIQELGPTFVKFGQMLSTRRDLLPDDVADELEKLQDAVPPFPGAIAQQIIEKAFGRPVEDVFDEFESEPLALFGDSGSIKLSCFHSAYFNCIQDSIIKPSRSPYR